MLTSLRIERDRIAMEAHLSHDLVGLLKNTFPTIKEEFARFVGSFSPSDPGIALTNKQQAFLSELGKHEYSDIRALRAFVPEGLQLGYLEYLKPLTPAVDHAANVLDFMSAYSVFLSQLISNADGKLSMVTHRRVNQDSEKARAALNDQLGKCFKPGSTWSEVTVGDVIGRNSDWRPAFIGVETLTRAINKVDRGQLQKKANECSELLDVLMNKIERGDLEDVSNQVVDNLADGAYTTARELEFFAATYYKTQALTTCVNRTVDHFIQVFKK